MTACRYNFTYPTTAWVPGERIVDVYDLPLPSGTPGGDFSPLLILYRAADGSEVGRVQLPSCHRSSLKLDQGRANLFHP